jgi:hypothetical protein
MRFPNLSQVFDSLPAQQAIARLVAVPSDQGYPQLKPVLAALWQAVVAQTDEDTALGYGLTLLLTLCESAPERWQSVRLPQALWGDFADSFHRQIDAIVRGGSSSWRMISDGFAKDVAIALFRLFPLGGQLVEPHSGLSRQAPLRDSLGKGMGHLAFLTRCGGFKPYLEMHTHDGMRHFFTADGWHYCYRQCQHVLAAFPDHKGVIGGSWFFDPALATASPNLSFVREVSLAWGGRLLLWGATPEMTANALLMSPARQAAFDAGTYSPKSYFMIVPRASIMAKAKLEKES